MGPQEALAVVAAGRALESAGLAGKALGERAGLYLAVGYIPFEAQDLVTTDFALDGVPIDGPHNVLLLGESAANYDLKLLMMTYSYRY